MKILNLIQGSQDWIDARYDYITATDVAAILGINPYETALDLFERKSMRQEKVFDERTKSLFEKGHKFESEIKQYLEESNIKLSNPVITHQDMPYLMASLDGITESNTTVYEFKYSQKSVNEVPAYHLSQVQTQLLLSEAERAFYIRGRSKEDYQVFSIQPDPKMQKEIIVKTKEFYERLQEGNPPEPSDRDCFTTDDPIFKMLYDTKKIIDGFQSQYDQLKLEIIKKYKEQKRVRGHGVLFMRSFRKGTIPYSKINEIKELNLEKYRTKGSEVMTFKVDK